MTMMFGSEDARPTRMEESRLSLGTVISQPPGTNRVDIRLEGSHHRVIRNVILPMGASLQADDLCLVCRVPGSTSWIALSKIGRSDEWGLALSQVTDETDLHPPSGFVVTPMAGGILGTWEGWPGRATCFQVQYGNKPNGSTAGAMYTYGSHYLYQVSGPGRKWIRVRACRYAPSERESYWSAYTPWRGAIPQLSTSELRQQLDEYMHLQEATWQAHLQGDL